MRTGELSPNNRNPRKISDPQLDMLKSSLELFGDLSGIIYNRRLSRLTGGTQRVRVLPKDCEITIIERFDPPTAHGTTAHGYVSFKGERYQYREVDWDESTDIAANIAANKHGGEFDMAILKTLLMELDQDNFDMPAVGFTDIELENLLAPISTDDIDRVGPEDGLEWSSEIEENMEYIVLTFSDKLKFKEACERLGVRRVNVQLSPNPDNESFVVQGTGRVISGDALDRL